MAFTLIVPRVSDFMDTAVIEWLAVGPGQVFKRGDVLVRCVVEMATEGDALACPPGMTLDLVAAEPGVLLDWKVEVGQQVPAGGLLATATAVDPTARSMERPLRCVPREILE